MRLAILLSLSLCSSAAAQGLLPKSMRDPLPNFDLQQLTGMPVKHTADFGWTTRNDLLGRVAVINFWAPWCASCVNLQRTLFDAAKAYADSGVVFMSMAVGSDEAAISKWLDQHGGARYAVFSMPEKLERPFEIHDLPRVILVDKTGKIALDRLSGKIPYDSLPGMLSALLHAPD